MPAGTSKVSAATHPGDSAYELVSAGLGLACCFFFVRDFATPGT